MSSVTTNSHLEAAYNRLDEAHRAWHLALSGYHKVDDFRAGVNSAIQSLRNITFALQNQKNNLPNFDLWYIEWQTRMSGDQILKELSSARVIVVHQKDLELKSKAVARLKDWVDVERIAFEFKPMEDTYSVAKGFYDVFIKHIPIPKDVKNRFVFEFERTWVYEKLPDHELLEALGHAINFFYEMLEDACREFSLPQHSNLIKGDYCPDEFIEKNLLKCTLITKRERSLLFNFENGDIIRMIGKKILVQESWKNKARQRYGDEWASKETVSLVGDLFVEEHPFDAMKTFVQAAIASLKKDKFLIPVSFIFFGKNKPPMIIVHAFENQEQKIMSMDKLSDEVVKNKGIFVLNIAEAWTASMDKKEGQENYLSYLRKNKKEVILIYCVSADNIKEVTIPFKRSILKKIIFSKPVVEDFATDDKHGANIMLDVIKALKKVKQG